MTFQTIKRGMGLAVVLAVVAGCSSNTKKEEVDPNANAQPVVQEPVQKAEPAPEVLETVFYFDFDESMLKPGARAELTKHAMRLKATPRNVRIEGHTDERGSREYNMALGERRANAVRDFLVLQGVDASMLEVVSYGEERPAAMGSNESAYGQNRRAEVK
ncbi:peptidoglycan-associated lipoprotein Pal [Simiduia aestuariiviva]|uniref:Peptidoglycan-associated lipoprotein n=1 Tax=Simiduia aestuariiviva TaxID=1510459 RepID=A0A839UTM8_9GAMM|nr:peptidoglycan-associated lipoprotein Pal [Simiduia aestuariiviva]MBB3168858.1 peptidoglycan-associated lipoprotein [Simiduia aestuariiviva]